MKSSRYVHVRSIPQAQLIELLVLGVNTDRKINEDPNTVEQEELPNDAETQRIKRLQAIQRRLP